LKRDSADLAAKVHKVRNALSVYVCGCGVVLALAIYVHTTCSRELDRFTATPHPHRASAPRADRDIKSDCEDVATVRMINTNQCRNYIAGSQLWFKCETTSGKDELTRQENTAQF